MKSHKDLEVWKAAIGVARSVYLLTRTYPQEELFGMTAQMRKAAVSIASNIAEGAARNGNKEFSRFLRIALGSAAELETQLVLSQEVDLAGPDAVGKIEEELTRVRRLLIGLDRSLTGE